AQDKLKLGTNKHPNKVKLICGPSGDMREDKSSWAVVSNPTAQDLPVGTLIYTASNIGTSTVNNQVAIREVLKKNQGNQMAVAFVKGRIASCEAWASVP